MSSLKLFYGGLVNPLNIHSFSLLPRCLLCIDSAGNVAWIIDDVQPHNLQETLASRAVVDVEFISLSDGEFIIPGFVDTHSHAPQHPNMGTGGQYELMDWLDKVTFPTEAKFVDVDFARHVYQSVVRRTLDAGTTTCCYYGTLHLEATKALVDIVHSLGQRAFVGKCSMNRNSPEYYVEPSSEASLNHTRELITYIRALPQPSTAANHEARVQPIITPRFAIACTDDLLAGLGDLAASEPDVRIQTHVSENPSEVSGTRSLFPSAPSYAGVYDMFGLLRSNTVLGHAVHLSGDEMELIKSRDAGISHCPTSNFNLNSGVAPVGVFLDMGIKVGLGTDVSGGYNNSILNAIQNASIASKVIAMSQRDAKPLAPSTATGFANKQLPIPTLLYLATAGGAKVCNLENQIGDFRVGKSFDALLVSVRDEVRNPGVWALQSETPFIEQEQLQSWLERFLFCGDDRNIRRVYVQGKFVGGKEFEAH